MLATRRAFLKNMSIGALVSVSLLTNKPQAQTPCTRVNGAGSYRLGPFDPLETDGEPVYLITDLGFDETMLFCKVSTNHAPFRFPTARMGVVEFGAHEFFMDMSTVQINKLDIVEKSDGTQARFEGELRSETRLFSGDETQTFVEESVVFSCIVTTFDSMSNIDPSTPNFALTANYDPEMEQSAIFGEQITFAGRLTQGNIMVIV